MCHSYFFHAQSEQPSQFTKCWSRLVIPGGLTAMLPLVERLVQLSGSWAVASVRTVYEVSVPPCKTWERTTMLLLVQRLAQSLNAGRQRHQLRESPWCKSQCSFKKLGCGGISQGLWKQWIFSTNQLSSLLVHLTYCSWWSANCKTLVVVTRQQ